MINQPPVVCLFSADIKANKVFRSDCIPVLFDESGSSVFTGSFTTDIEGKRAKIVVIWRESTAGKLIEVFQKPLLLYL